ncbi:hypothetical protein CA233_19070 [Sphingomonas sp. ABOLD]|uniref:Uncharacterized protein n=1 Tax=Sphingomonas trueperi TaxID=53317 RepID=A0A7X5Y1K1_9SPHN|nr:MULTISPECIES: hypothetical protein [Sphingomonas]NJB99397.1 hypothetical protein [Sphingomonas trueperi]RSV34847.1 hypothetical protein CA234_20705 [Sphingomonas sp. ABOLE]RSV40941.1 hypothetical protein CA233_19070 [Sphingomonas sp. ABOLD]
MTAPARFTKTDIKRALSGAREAGFARVRVGIDVNGNMVIDASDDPMTIVEATPNPLDRLLKGR